MKDILPDEISQWQGLEAEARAVFAVYNYSEIRPPLLEEAALFNRSLGSSTEIVQKQMFLVHNQEDVYALRPEGTASVVRAYIENSLDKRGKLSKLFYLGPMFRLERPQKGRLRQFHHFGCEVIGSYDGGVDVEVIALAKQLLDTFGVSGYRLKLNSLGCSDDKQKLADTLRQALASHKNELCEDCQLRLKQNVLRILDCKKEQCKAVIHKLEAHDSYLCEECARHFDEVKKGLDLLNISYEVAAHLVRGLDYYTRTVFEFTHDDLGAQDALGAGGRYDNLVAELGGPSMGACGFAFGVERVCLVVPEKQSNVADELLFVISLGDEARKKAGRFIHELRNLGICCDTDYEGKSLKGALRQAHDYKARYVVIIGDNELQKGIITLKDMQTGEQNEMEEDKLLSLLGKKV